MKKKHYNILGLLFIFLMAFIVIPQNVKADNIICVPAIRDFIKKLWGYLEIAAPTLLLIMSSIEFFKAIIASDNEALSKSVNRTIKRVIALIVLFLVPLIISVIFQWFNLESSLCF